MFIDVCSFKGDVSVKVDGIVADKPLKDVSSNGHKVSSVYAKDSTIAIELETIIPNDINADWVKIHTEKYGVEPNIFEG